VLEKLIDRLMRTGDQSTPALTEASDLPAK
jgi:hypothetical protein